MLVIVTKALAIDWEKIAQIIKTQTGCQNSFDITSGWMGQHKSVRIGRSLTILG